MDEIFIGLPHLRLRTVVLQPMKALDIGGRAHQKQNGRNLSPGCDRSAIQRTGPTQTTSGYSTRTR
jgi:hypothetical protein